MDSFGGWIKWIGLGFLGLIFTVFIISLLARIIARAFYDEKHRFFSKLTPPTQEEESANKFHGGNRLN